MWILFRIKDNQIEFLFKDIVQTSDKISLLSSWDQIMQICISQSKINMAYNWELDGPCTLFVAWCFCRPLPFEMPYMIHLNEDWADSELIHNQRDPTVKIAALRGSWDPPKNGLPASFWKPHNQKLSKGDHRKLCKRYHQCQLSMNLLAMTMCRSIIGPHNYMAS